MMIKIHSKVLKELNLPEKGEKFAEFVQKTNRTTLECSGRRLYETKGSI